MAIISFGRIDKKLLLVFFILIVNGIKGVISMVTSNEFLNPYLADIETDIGIIIAVIIINFCFKKDTKKKIQIKI